VNFTLSFLITIRSQPRYFRGIVALDGQWKMRSLLPLLFSFPGTTPSKSLTDYSLSIRRVEATRPYRSIRLFPIGMELITTPDQLTTLCDIQRSTAHSTSERDLSFLCGIMLGNFLNRQHPMVSFVLGSLESIYGPHLAVSQEPQ